METGSTQVDQVRRLMSRLSWTLEFLSSSGASWPLELCSAWESQLMGALSESQLPSMDVGAASTSVTLKIWRYGLVRVLSS